jgi:hypothetical protein
MQQPYKRQWNNFKVFYVILNLFKLGGKWKYNSKKKHSYCDFVAPKVWICNKLHVFFFWWPSLNLLMACAGITYIGTLFGSIPPHYCQLRYIHTYHSRCIPEGVAQVPPQMFFRDAHILLKLLSYEENCRCDRW